MTTEAEERLALADELDGLLRAPIPKGWFTTACTAMRKAAAALRAPNAGTAEQCAAIADGEAAEYQRQIDEHNAEMLKFRSFDNPDNRERGVYLHAKQSASSNIAGLIRALPANAGTAENVRIITELKNEIAHLTFCLHSRDDYIGSIDKWQEYVDTLPHSKAGIPGVGYSDKPTNAKLAMAESVNAQMVEDVAKWKALYEMEHKQRDFERDEADELRVEWVERAFKAERALAALSAEAPPNAGGVVEAIEKCAMIADEMFSRYSDKMRADIERKELAEAWSIGMTSASKIATQIRALVAAPPAPIKSEEAEK